MKIRLPFVVIVMLSTIAAMLSFSLLILWQTNWFFRLSDSEVIDLIKTKFTVDATLFGLCTLSGAIFLSMTTRQEKSDYGLTRTILILMGVSFLSFFLALVWDILTFSDPNDKATLGISIGYTLSGAAAGSVYLVWNFSKYLQIQQAREPKPIEST